MDVVRRNIERLRGKIEIETAVGAGSTFRIKLPLTMAIIDGLVVRVGADRFILPSTSVKMALRPAREALITVHGTGEALDLRGKILPLHRLHRQFSIPNAVENPWEGIVVIVEVSGKIEGASGRRVADQTGGRHQEPRQLPPGAARRGRRRDPRRRQHRVDPRSRLAFPGRLTTRAGTLQSA